MLQFDSLLRRRDQSTGVRAEWPRQILKTGTLEMQFPAIWSSTLQDLVTLWSKRRKKLHLRRTPRSL